jgi:purine nucleoside phosphorylase
MASLPARSPSAASVAQDVVFIARHGYGHTIPPHLVNYRANMHALESRASRR